MSRTGNDAGDPSQYVILAGNSTDGHAHGGHNVSPPPTPYRRVQVRATEHPVTDRWITLTTIRLAPSPLFRVGVVDGHNCAVSPPRDYSTLRKARNAANRLYAALTERSSDDD